MEYKGPGNNNGVVKGKSLSLRHFFME